jgi:hypothetical protein
MARSHSAIWSCWYFGDCARITTNPEVNEESFNFRIPTIQNLPSQNGISACSPGQGSSPGGRVETKPRSCTEVMVTHFCWQEVQEGRYLLARRPLQEFPPE